MPSCAHSCCGRQQHQSPPVNPGRNHRNELVTYDVVHPRLQTRCGRTQHHYSSVLTALRDIFAVITQFSNMFLKLSSRYRTPAALYCSCWMSSVQCLYLEKYCCDRAARAGHNKRPTDNCSPRAHISQRSLRACATHCRGEERSH